MIFLYSRFNFFSEATHQLNQNNIQKKLNIFLKDGERIQHSDEKTQKFQNQTEENISTGLDLLIILPLFLHLHSVLQT